MPKLLTIPDTFDGILQSAELIALFRVYLDERFCAENISFWVEIEQYRDESPEVRQVHSHKIWKDYFPDNSEKQININADVYQLTESQLKSDPSSPEIFTTAQKYIYFLMEQESYGKFKLSKLLKDFMDGDDTKRQELLKKHKMRKPSIELLDAYAEKYNYNIIGGNLTNIMVQQRKTDKTTLAPYIILRTVEVLMLKGLGVKEIFENATASSVSQLMQGFNTGEDFQIKQTNYTANDVMGLLNTFLQSLKQPLIPLNYLEMFLDVLDQESKDKSVNVVTGIAQIINSKLSKDEYNALQALIFLSYHLNLNSQTNELNLKIITAKLIVPIFLPNTISHTENQILIKEKTKQQVLDEIIALGKLLIKKYKELFKNYFNYYGINKYLQLLYKYGGHEKSIRGIRKLDKEIWSYDYRGAIHIWSLQHSKFIKAIQLPMPINDLIFINEEVWIVGDYLLIIHLQTHEVIKSFKSANLLEPDFSFSVSEGLNNTVWVGRSDSISIYDKKEKTLIQELNIVAQEDHPGSGKTRFCNSIILVSKQYLWCAFSDGFIHIFNPETLAEITSFKAHSLTINSLIYVNSLVWSCSDDKTIAVWHANGDFYKRLDDHTSKVITLASYKDVFVCSSSWDNDIFLWDAKLLTLISKIQTTGHKDAITSLLFIDLSRKKRPSVAFSNVATRLSSATSKDAKLHLWTGSFDKMISIFLVNYQNWQMKLSKGIRNTIALTNSSYIISRTLQSSGSNSNVRYALFPPEITRFFESKSTNVISESMLEIDWSRSFNKNGILAYYKGKVQSQQVMACVIEPALYLDPNLSQEILNFLYKTRTLAHPNFALCLGFASVNGNIVVLTKYEKRNSLREVIISGNKGTPLERLTMAKELAIALSWLHNSDPPIGHYDLKDSCILLGKNSAVKLTNFGYFELKQKQERYKKEIPIHLAPEIVLGQPFGIKADIFSYGLLIWQCWTGQLAPIQLNKVVIENYEKLKSSLEEKHRITVGAIPARLIKLITNCQNDDPEKRPTALEILAAFDELYTDCIVQDFEGRTFWKMYYPHSQIVNCNILVSSIGTYFTIKELEDACTPQSFAMKILFETPKGSGNSSVQRFADLIQWFGPFNKSIVTKIVNLFSEKWFVGELCEYEAEKLLHSGKKGYFLVRFAERNTSNFYISVLGDAITHYRVTQSDGTFKFGKGTFDTLQELVKKNRNSLNLKIPFKYSEYYHTVNWVDRREPGFDSEGYHHE